MIGIILWAILIIIIAEAACPGLIWVILGTMVAFGLLYFGVVYIVSKIQERKDKF